MGPPLPCRYQIPALPRAATHRRDGPFLFCGHYPDHPMLPLACRFQPHNARPKSILDKQYIGEASFCIAKAR
jgi:hypothetical protein